MSSRRRTEECPICCNVYTDHQRRLVQCGYCQSSCCSACLQQYLLGLSGDAHCMTCKHAFDGEFLGMHLPKTWLLTKYRQHREKVLLERELALMPDSQQLLDNYRQVQRAEQQLQANEQRKRQLQRQLENLAAESARQRTWVDRVKRSNYTQVPGNAGNGGGDNAGASGSRQRRQFIRACPVEGCRGYLSTAWKCGTCEVRVCRHCGEPKNGKDGDNKNKGKTEVVVLLSDDDDEQVEADDDGHVCDPNVAASHALLQRDSRPCPKCASMIYKISGCDQMWCTQCNVAFSWSTGEVVTNGVIHNPHYYEWLRRSRGEVPRNPDDVPGGVRAGGRAGGRAGEACGRLPSLYDLDACLLRRKAPMRLANRVRGLYRLVAHTINVDLRRLRREADDGGDFRRNADLRLAYLLNEIGRDNLSRKLQQREKRRERAFRECQVFDMFCTVGTDTVRELMQDLKSAEEAAQELEALLAFANDSLETMAKGYNVLPKKIGP